MDTKRLQELAGMDAEQLNEDKTIGSWDAFLADLKRYLSTTSKIGKAVNVKVKLGGDGKYTGKIVTYSFDGSDLTEGAMKDLLMDVVDMETGMLVDLVAEHLWHNYMKDGDVEEFFGDVKQRLAAKRKSGQPEK